MAYRLPKGYDNDDASYSEDEGSVDMSVGIDDSTVECGSEGEYSEEEEEEERPRSRKPAARTASNSSSGGRRGGPPRRSKSFQEDTLRSRGGGSGHARSSHGRRPPPRSNTFDAGHSSMRSMGGPRMPRRENSLKKTALDKETIASNRARRLRAMGDGPKGQQVKLVRSQSFKMERKKENSLLGNDNDDNDNEDDEKKGERSRPKPPQRSTSNDLAPEERQYARTAARGVTRSKSLKAERPNLEMASNRVANRLNRMGGGGGAARTTPSTRPTRKGARGSKEDVSADAAAEDPAASPKAVGLQW